MKTTIVAAFAVVTLGGCIAVADPYGYPAPSVGVVYSAPVYRHHWGHRPHHGHHQHHYDGHRRHHWRGR